MVAQQDGYTMRKFQLDAGMGGGCYALPVQRMFVRPRPGWLCALVDIDVELAVADAAGEGFPLGWGEGEDGAGGVLGVPYADAAVGSEGDFHAVVSAAAAAGLAPVGERAGFHHGSFSVSCGNSCATAARKSRLSGGVSAASWRRSYKVR